MSGGTPIRYSSCSQSLAATSSSTRTMKRRSSGCPHPTTTWPWISRSSMRYRSSATLRSNHDKCGPALLGGVRHGLGIAGFGVERKVEQGREVRAHHHGKGRLFALDTASGHRAASRRQVGEDHVGAARREPIAQQLLDVYG